CHLADISDRFTCAFSNGGGLSMVDVVATDPRAGSRPKLEAQPNMIAVLLFLALLGTGILFTAYSLHTDIVQSGMPMRTWLPFLLLAAALVIALGFEFVNGFHDTANAVATVIYTHSMPANLAVVWSGFFNFLGVLLSSGAVAFGIISLLPVELILQVGSNAGVRAVDRGHPMEPRHLGLRFAGIEFAHPDRLDHRRRRDERHHARPRRHLGRRLVESQRGR